MSTYTGSILISLGTLALLILVQVQLSRQRSVLPGLIMPAAFLFLAAANLYRSLFVPNPYPTMREGMLMTAGLAGLVITVLVLLLCRRRAPLR